MSPNEVRNQIDAIRRCAEDDEAAHGMEDSLRADVLRAIANGEMSAVESMQCAALALTTDQIAFSRWCA